MKKIVLILIFGLTLALSAPGVVDATYENVQLNSLWYTYGDGFVPNANKCSTENFCFCNFKAREDGAFTDTVSDYSGIFKYDTDLFTFDSDLRERFYWTEINSWVDSETLTATLAFDDNTKSCVVSYKIPPPLTSNNFLDWPNITCQYHTAVGYGCCCANNPDGSVECGDPIPKVPKGAACELTCPNSTDSKYEVEGADCSAHEKKAYVSTSTANIDLKSIRAEAAKQLNPLKWLSGTPTNKINQLIGTVIKFLMMAIGSLLLLFYVYAGFLWMTAQGNAEAITKAKTILFWSTLAIVVQLFAGILVSSVFGLLTTG